MKPIIDLKNVSKHFQLRGGPIFGPAPVVRAVDNVDLTIAPGEVVGLVGESGSGKSTLGRLIVKLLEPTTGQIEFDGEDINEIPLRQLRRSMQFIFQDPYSSLDPRKTVAKLIGDSYAIHNLYSRADRREQVVALLERVGLNAGHIDRLPHEFSGGQRQRIGIARALAVKPRLIVADEPVSALDVSVQAQIINLMAGLQEEFNLSMLFISHDLNVVEYLADRVVVMYLGRIMEEASAKSLYARPRHPYSHALLSAAPEINPARRRNRVILKGDLPSPIDPPSGCVFRTRCPHAIDQCAVSIPPLVEVSEGHRSACIRDGVV